MENEDIVELIKSNVKLKIIIERLTNMSFGQSKMSWNEGLSCLYGLALNERIEKLLNFEINFHRSGIKS